MLAVGRGSYWTLVQYLPQVRKESGCKPMYPISMGWWTAFKEGASHRRLWPNVRGTEGCLIGATNLFIDLQPFCFGQWVTVELVEWQRAEA